MTEPDGPRWGPATRGAAPRQLVVLCHGVGANGDDLIGLAPAWGRAVPEAAFVAPDAPQAFEMGGQFGVSGRQWFSLSDLSPSALEAGVRRAVAVLDPFIDAELARLGLPADAYALMGFSQGAMVALFSGLRRKVPPRAILAFSGALIGPQLLAFERRNAAPVLLVHGERDDIVPAFRSRDAERALRRAMVPVESLFVPALGHGIDEAGLSAGASFLRKAFGIAG